jgi:hypothetical protein
LKRRMSAETNIEVHAIGMRGKELRKGLRSRPVHKRQFPV